MGKQKIKKTPIIFTDKSTERKTVVTGLPKSVIASLNKNE